MCRGDVRPSLAVNTGGWGRWGSSGGGVDYRHFHRNHIDDLVAFSSSF